MKCKDGHEMMLKAKFCGECGGTPAIEETPNKCNACEGEMAKSAKFCPDCGVQASTTVAQLDQVAEQLAEFAKARVAQTAALQDVPAIEDAGIVVDESRVDEILAKASITDGDGNEGVDALPIVAEFLKGQSVTDARLIGIGEHLNRKLSVVFADNGMLLKAVTALVGMVKAQGEEIATLGSKPVGRKTVIQVSAGTPQSSEIPFGDLTGNDLIAKAAVACDRDPRVLNTTEFSKLESYANQGFTLKAICDGDAELGPRVQRAIALLEQTTH